MQNKHHSQENKKQEVETDFRYTFEMTGSKSKDCFGLDP